MNGAATPEVEETIERLSSHKNVRGVMVCSREGPIIRHTGATFEGEQGKKYAGVVKKIVDCVVNGLEEVGGTSGGERTGGTQSVSVLVSLCRAVVTNVSTVG